MDQIEKKRLTFPLLIKIIKETIKGIGEDNVIRVSASLAFATLFSIIGQWGISVYFGLSNVGSVYGVAAFLAIVLTWIYYSAIIIFIGAEFTQAWANEVGSKIYPDEYAVATKVVEYTSDND